MKTIIFCFVALFAAALAVPIFEESVEIDFNDEFFEDDKIVGGNATTIETHPYTVSFRRLNRHICGASVLTTTRALTAAHCISRLVPASQYSIQAGSTLRLGDSNAQVRQLTRLLQHARYNTPRLANDIAILYWTQPLVFGANVRAVTLPRLNAPAPYGRNVNVTGWGALRENGPSPNILQVVTKPLVSNANCNRAYNGRITPDMLCAGLPQGGRDACQGDSGGPLTLNGVQLGVVSWGTGCARPRFPGVYARVATFTNWIAENL